MPRPKKYATEAERKAAGYAKTKRYREKKKKQKEQQDAALRAVEPVPQLDDSAEPTSSNLGIRADGLDIPSGLYILAKHMDFI
jgi:hypothetical protein